MRQDRSAQRHHHIFTVAAVLAAILAAGTVAADPPSSSCATAADPGPYCSGDTCVELYRECGVDFDGLSTNGYEQTVLLFKNVGSNDNNVGARSTVAACGR